MKPNFIGMQIQPHKGQAEDNVANGKKCPNCPGIDLVMTERQGVEIDCCPKCRGVWLDRGELDKVIERSVADLTEPHIHRAPLPGYRERYEHAGVEAQHHGCKG